MATIPVVENPRRKRRRYSAKQRSYGFGGGRRRKRSTTKRRRRRNPALAALATNPRRRRYGRRSSPRRRSSSYRRRRNPQLLGMRGFDLGAAMWVGVGVVGPKYLLRFASRQFPQIPTTGFLGYGVRAMTVWATAWLASSVFKQRRAHGYIMAGGLGMILVDVFNEYVAPSVPGLAGMGDDYGYVDASELDDALSGYERLASARVPGIAGMGAYQDASPTIMTN